MSTDTRIDFDRHVTLGDLAVEMRRNLHRSLMLLALLLGAEGIFLWFTHSPGVLAYCLIALGTWVCLSAWSTWARGLPMLPVLAIQHFVAYALPIAVGHEVLAEYPVAEINQAGIETLTFLLSLTCAWRIGMEVLRPGSAFSYALQGFERGGMKRLRWIGSALLLVSTLVQVLQASSLWGTIYGILPNGSFPIINAFSSAMATCGFFLYAMLYGTNELTPANRTFFWVVFSVICLLSASGLLLSGAAIYVGSVTIGLLWGRGRIPWRFVFVVLLILSFLSLGKSSMRTHYWHLDENEEMETISLLRIPSFYVEWSQASAAALLNKDAETGQMKSTGGTSLSHRVNNLQNLLFVISAVEEGHVTTLQGATYTLIPPLLIPRFFWADKPRAHEGQVMLNVHFGRQDLNSTFQTYIAWGLLPEAYGNYGSFYGALLLGLVLGWFCAWMENYTARKLVLSLEGFICFTIFLGLLGSYEMVASVMVTSIFQSIIPIFLACAPFVERQRAERIQAL